jgi:hypothetical protein
VRIFRGWIFVGIVGATMTPCAAVPFIGASPATSSPAPPPFYKVVGVSNAGVAVGVSSRGNAAERAIRFSAAGTAELPALTPSPYSTSGHGFVTAVGVSGDGIVIGTSWRFSGTTYLDSPGVYWDANNAIHLMQPPAPPAGGKSSVTPKAISRNGRVAAESSVYSSTNLLLSSSIQRYQSASDAPTALASAPLATSYALGINTAGTTVGYISGGPGVIATRWKSTGTSVEWLPSAEPTSPDASRVANAVNDSDVAVGYNAHFVGSIQRGQFAVRWDADGTATSLGALEVKADGTQASNATLINNAGDIAGSSTRYTGVAGRYAVRWLPGSTTPVALEPITTTPGGVVDTIARAMNADGTVVGATSYANSTTTRAALWTKSSNQAIELHTLLPAGTTWTLERADAISDTGWISGLGRFDPDGTGPIRDYARLFSMLVPQAGTYGRGDANFDTQIDFADLLLLAQHYNQSNATQDVNVADFDLNRTTDFNDLLTLAQNYQTAGSFEADWALARSLVPEPSILVALGVIWGRRR